MLFRQDAKNLSHIYQDHCTGDGISFEQFSNYCNGVWTKPYHFVIIDLSRSVDCGKYRKI